MFDELFCHNGPGPYRFFIVISEVIIVLCRQISQSNANKLTANSWGWDQLEIQALLLNLTLSVIPF